MANNVTLSYPSAFHHQFFDRNGKPLTDGKLYTYSAGTSTPVQTYKTIGDTSSANTNTNPIILDNAGMAYIVIETDKAYKFVLFDKNDAKIAEWDNVTGNIGGGGSSSEDIVVVGTPNEIDVSGSVTQGVKRYVISLSNSVKSTILYLVGLYNNVLNSLGNKADKVQGATAGNLAALDANGNITDSGSKAADFKTKQTPVADPSASGNGLDFIDSISQDANGEITPHKKAVQDGTTAQKGVVKLSNAIDSTSTTEAATPKAVKDAYDELNNKIVARAVFLSQAEWAVQSQLQGDPAKVYYVENGTGEDAYTVYVWKESTSTYEEVDESSIDLDGYWHDSPTTTGSGNVVTNITLGNDGVPQVEKGMSAEPAFSVLPVNKGGTGKTTGKAATNNLFSDINSVNTDPDDTARIVFKYGSPSDSNGIFFARSITNLWNYIKGKISSVLGLSENGYTGNAATASAAASGSALETAINAKLGNTGDASNTTSTFSKATGDTSTMTSGSKLSALFTTISSFFASVASALGGKADKANITGATKCKITYNSQGIVTSGADLGASDIPNLPASKITSGTFDAARIPTSLPNTSIGGSAAYTNFIYDGESAGKRGDGQKVRMYGIDNTNNDYQSWYKVATIKKKSQTSYTSARLVGTLFASGNNWASNINQAIHLQILFKFVSLTYKIYHTPNPNVKSLIRIVAIDNNDTYELQIRPQGLSNYSNFRLYIWDDQDNNVTVSFASGAMGEAASNGTVLDNYQIDPYYGRLANEAVGNSTTPVYVDSDGQVQPCDPSQMGVGAASYAEKAKEGCKGSNTATLYIAGTFGEGNIPYYNVKDVKNGCVNYVHVKDIPYNTCSITIEAPDLASGEEYDYVVVFDTFTNSNLIGSIDVENCKTAGRMDNGVFVVDSMVLTSGNPRYVPMIVVTGNVASSKWYERL